MNASCDHGLSHQRNNQRFGLFFDKSFIATACSDQHATSVRSPELRYNTRRFSAVAFYCRCHCCATFWILGLQTSFTNTNAKVFASGRLNLYTPGPLQFLGAAPFPRVS